MVFVPFPEDGSDWRMLKNSILAILNRLQENPKDIQVYDVRWAKQHDPKRLGVQHVCLPFGELPQAQLFIDTLATLAKEKGIEGGSQGVPFFEARPVDSFELAQYRALQAEGIVPINFMPKAVAVINAAPKLLPVIDQLRDALFLTRMPPGQNSSWNVGDSN